MGEKNLATEVGGKLRSVRSVLLCFPGLPVQGELAAKKITQHKD